MATELYTTEYYDTDGNLLDSVTVEIEVQSPQELIAQKEQELLTMYADLQALKAQQNNG
jgi:hypothetical protein